MSAVDTSPAAIVSPRPVPADLLDVLRENSPEFAASFDHRPARSGWSASEYDMSIAGMLVNAGFDAQLVADLLAAHRLHHDPRDRKAQRLDYLRRTIISAGGRCTIGTTAGPSWPEMRPVDREAVDWEAADWCSPDRPPLAILETYSEHRAARVDGVALPPLTDGQERLVDACWELLDRADRDPHLRAAIDARQAGAADLGAIG